MSLATQVAAFATRVGQELKATRALLSTPAVLPPASPIFLRKSSGGVWPGVPTTRTDIPIVWVGADPSPATVQARTLGQAGFLDNVDLRVVI
jgi:hypothetical protein